MNGLMQYNPTPIKTRGQAIRELQAEQSGQMQNALLQMQMQNALAQQQERQQQNALMAKFRDSIPSPQMQASQAALMGGGGPTVANAQRMQPVDQRIQMADQAFRAGAMPLGEYMNMRFPAPEKPTDKVVGDALVRIGPKGVQELYKATPKDARTGDQKDYEYSVAQGYRGTFEQWDKERRKAAASNVSLSTGDVKLPPGVLKQQDEMIDRMTSARSIQTDLAAIQKRIESGQLDFGPIRNLVNTGRNAAGVSSPESRAFASFKSSLEKLRNDSLRLNAGVQTEGDAQRAWNELFQSINDRDLVMERLKEIQAINDRAAKLHEYRLQVLRENFGARPLAGPQIAPALPTAPTQPGVIDFGSLK